MISILILDHLNIPNYTGESENYMYSLRTKTFQIRFQTFSHDELINQTSCKYVRRVICLTLIINIKNVNKVVDCVTFLHIDYTVQ